MNTYPAESRPSDLGGVFLVQLPGQGPGGATSRVAGVVEEDPLVPLGAGQRYVPAVDHHHMVPAVTWGTRTAQASHDQLRRLQAAR